MDSDNSLEINIEAVDDASEVFAGVSDAAEGMSESINDAAKSINGSLEAVGSSALDMSTEMEGAVTSVEEGVNGMSETVNESTLSAKEAFDLMNTSVVDSVTSMDESIDELNASMDAMDKSATSNSSAFDTAVTEMQAETAAAAEGISTDAELITTAFLSMSEESIAAMAEMDTSTAGTSAGMAGAAAGLLLISQQLKGISTSLDTEISSAYDATGKWNQSILELNTVLKDNGESIPTSQLIAFTQQMQNTTLFQQQAVLDSETQVLSHKELASSYQSIIELAADLATKMKVDLPTATGVLTDAFSEPTVAMNTLVRQYKVDIPTAIQEAIKKTDAAGDSAGAAALLFQTLSGQLGGLSTAADTASGTGMQKLNNDFQSMQQNMQGVTQVIDTLAGALADILKPIANFVEEHPKITAVVLLSLAAFVGLAAFLTGVFAVALLFIVGTLSPVLAGFALWIVGITLIGTLTVEVATAIILNWTSIKTETLKILNDIGDGLAAFGTMLINVFDTTMQDVEGAWNASWKAIENAFIDSIDFMIDKINDFIKGIDSMLAALKSVPGLGAAMPNISIPLIPTITQVDDAIISPGGNVITTNPADYLIATTNPGSLLGGGVATGGQGNITVNITGSVWSTKDQAIMYGNEIAKVLGRQLKLSTRP